jgi:hypothetical protein
VVGLNREDLDIAVNVREIDAPAIGGEYQAGETDLGIQVRVEELGGNRGDPVLRAVGRQWHVLEDLTGDWFERDQLMGEAGGNE